MSRKMTEICGNRDSASSRVKSCGISHLTFCNCVPAQSYHALTLLKRKTEGAIRSDVLIAPRFLCSLLRFGRRCWRHSGRRGCGRGSAISRTPQVDAQIIKGGEVLNGLTCVQVGAGDDITRLDKR